MVKCGVERYDNLPGRVDWIDVDYLRYRYLRCIEPLWYARIPIIGFILHPAADHKTFLAIEARLEDAYKKHKLEEKK